jgi:hypothetical protein
MESKDSDFLLNARNLQLTIYISMVVANVLFVLLYPEHIVIGVIGAIFFLVLLARFWHNSTAKTSSKKSDTSQTKKSTH